MNRCTCPPGQTGPTYVREIDCPQHGLQALALDLESMRLFRYDDGYQMMARTEAAADAMHRRHVLRKS